MDCCDVAEDPVEAGAERVLATDAPWAFGMLCELPILCSESRCICESGCWLGRRRG